jgi:hypothetical protein
MVNGMIDKICEKCGNHFSVKPYQVRKGWAKFCSGLCYSQSRIKEVERICSVCGKKFIVNPCDIRKGAGKHCSTICRDIARTNFKEVNCPICSKLFKVNPYQTSRSRGIYCSLSCMGKSKIGKMVGENNPIWAGDNPKYVTLHQWVKRHKPKSIDGICHICNQKKKLELSNISGEYKRDINDFEWICHRCHIIKDGVPIKTKYNLKQYHTYMTSV